MKLAHISDLHFHESLDGSVAKHRHSLECLKGIETFINEQHPDHLIVTGDITNIGDKGNLKRAYQWIHDQIYEDGEYYGLHATERGLRPIIVPGNHDAFNARSTGDDFKRWQSSLSNFYSVFRQSQWDKDQLGVTYRWHDDGDVSVFFCLVDSCYLGDSETEHLDHALSLDRVAKGRLSRRQSAKILSLFDLGIAGEIADTNGIKVSRNRFLGALKILVMHHYLFEPADSRAEPLLHMRHKRTVFQNIAMSDFDLLLCGHKHIADFYVSSYADNFDARGHIRLAFNYVRRVLGIRSLPLGNTEDGPPLGKFLRLVIGLLAIRKAGSGSLDDRATDEIVRILERALKNPRVLKSEFVRYLDHYARGLDGLVEPGEVNELYSKIKAHFDGKDRKVLNDAAIQIREIISHLQGRPFAHVMSASSAKATESGTRNRAVNTYEIERSRNPPGYVFHISRFSWDRHANAFGNPIREHVMFPSSRGFHPSTGTAEIDLMEDEHPSASDR